MGLTLLLSARLPESSEQPDVPGIAPFPADQPAAKWFAD